MLTPQTSARSQTFAGFAANVLRVDGDKVGVVE